MTKIDYSNMTAEERREALAQLQAADLKAAEQAKADIQAYKDLVNQTVLDCFPKLTSVSEMLAAEKRWIRTAFNTALDLKAKIYGITDGQTSHQFMDAEGKRRIRIGANMIDDYDDTAETGIAMVKEYLAELGDTENSRQAVKLALSLLAKDKKGTLKASRIMTLRKHALESGNAKFLKGVDTIMEAYKPIPSKEFVRAEYKNADGAWVAIPLGMTEAE